MTHICETQQENEETSEVKFGTLMPDRDYLITEQAHVLTENGKDMVEEVSLDSRVQLRRLGKNGLAQCGNDCFF